MKVAAVREQKKDAPSSPLADCLADCRLSSASEPVQPEDRGVVEVFSPWLDFIQDSLPCTTKTAFSISVLIAHPRSTAAAVQHGEVGCKTCE